jgi:hypothetical protein
VRRGSRLQREIIAVNTKSIPLWIIRVATALLLIMGIMVWPGNADGLITPHIGLGVVLTIALLVVDYQAFRAGVSPGLVGLAVVWALALPVLGLTQEMLPESFAVFTQLFHLLLGVGAWLLAETLVRRMTTRAR